MLLKKTGFPEEDEMVLCTVTGVNPHSVFCTLDEYGGRTGMIHISEVAPGRIRNIKEYVQEGKKVVCKVLQVKEDRGHIDLSLRRVNEAQKRNKLNQIKQEQLAEKIIEYVARQLGENTLTLHGKLSEKLMKEYGSIFEAFEETSNDKLDLEKIVDKKAAKLLTEQIKARIKPPQLTIGGDLSLTSYATEGLAEIKEALQLAEKAGVEVRYLGAGSYHLKVTAEAYKDAEKKLKKAIDDVEAYSEKKNIEFEWKRKEE